MQRIDEESKWPQFHIAQEHTAILNTMKHHYRCDKTVYGSQLLGELDTEEPAV